MYAKKTHMDGVRTQWKTLELEMDGFGASIAMEAGYDPHPHLDVLRRVSALRTQSRALDMTAFDSKLPDLDSEDINAKLFQLKRLVFERTGPIYRIWPQEILNARIESNEQCHFAHFYEVLAHLHWVLPRVLRRVQAEFSEELAGKPYWMRWWMQLNAHPL